MRKTKISILIANYNGEKYLAKCINSCIKQDIKKNFEIIFIDDNSTDNSLKRLKKFKGKIKLIKNDKIKNISIFNTYYQLNSYYQGLKKAKGEIICFLDSDDFLKKDKLSQIEYHFNTDNKLDIVFDKPVYIDSNNKIFSKDQVYGFRNNKWPQFPPQSCISIKKEIIKKNKKKLFQKKFPLTTLDFRVAALADANREKTLFLNKELTYYYQHDKNESNKNFKFFNYNWFKRRLEAYKYYKLINKKNFITIDYSFTLIANLFLFCIYFCMRKKD